MILKAAWNGGEVSVTYTLSESDLQVLNHLKEHGYMEFKNGAETDIVDGLYDYGFIKSNDDSWHYTVELTVLGNTVVQTMTE